MALVTIIMTVIIYNQSRNAERADLLNTAEELAASITEMQTYGLGVKERGTGTGQFAAGYGLSLYSDDYTGTDSNNAYILFADYSGGANGWYLQNNNNTGYSCPSNSECLSKIDIYTKKKIEIGDICHIRGNSYTDTCGVVGRVDISFLRPQVEAVIRFRNTGLTSTLTPTNLRGVKIKLKSASGLERSVVVYTTGQVSVR